MIRDFVATAASAALCLGATAPAMAQDRYFVPLEGPRGASATVNLRIPLDRRVDRPRPSVGLTLSYGRSAGEMGDPQAAVTQLRMADLRFDRDGLARAELATFDLAHLDEDPRLNLGEGKSYMIWLILAAFASLAVVYAIADDSSSSESSDPDYTPPPGGG